MKRPIAILVGFLVGVLPAWSADWPQWRGPDRDGTSKETGLLKQWPKEGPKLLWKGTKVGGGYSTPSVVGERVYLLVDRGKEEFAVALNGKDGKPLWSTRLGAVGKNYGPQYPGARSTPTVDGDVLYALGSDGDLVCLETAKGKERWRKHLRTDFGGQAGSWAYAESPLVDGDALICTPGGKEATMIALKKKTGDVIWKAPLPAKDTSAGYASPVIGEVGKVKQYIQFLGSGVVGVEAKSGKLLWRNTDTMGIADIVTPLFHDGYVFTAAAFAGGAVVKLTAENDKITPQLVYKDAKLAISLGGVVRVGDYLYGATKQGLHCFELATGKVKWSNPSVGVGSVCYADGHIYLRSEEGDVALVEANPAEYREKGRFHQPERSKSQAWPYPIIANGCLYLRDQDVVLCYDIKEK
jgi:outer membrane protein assembly factor BamB